jgi:hypothetical protein
VRQVNEMIGQESVMLAIASMVCDGLLMGGYCGLLACWWRGAISTTGERQACCMQCGM